MADTQTKSEPKNVAPLDVTMKRVTEELTNDGRTRVDIDKEAAGSEGLATSIIQSAATSLAKKVETKVNKKSVSGKVAENDD